MKRTEAELKGKNKNMSCCKTRFWVNKRNRARSASGKQMVNDCFLCLCQRVIEKNELEEEKKKDDDDEEDEEKEKEKEDEERIGQNHDQAFRK